MGDVVMDVVEQLRIERLATKAGILVPGPNGGMLALDYEMVCTCGCKTVGWGIHRPDCPVHTWHVQPADRHTLLKELLGVHGFGLDVKPEGPRHQLSFHTIIWSEDVDQLVAMEGVLREFADAGAVTIPGLAKLVSLAVMSPTKIEVESIDINFADDEVEPDETI